MRKMSRTKRVLLAAGMAVVTLGLAAPAAAEEPAGMSVLTTPRSAPNPTASPAVVPDAENPAGVGLAGRLPEARTESPALPTPSDVWEPPPPPDTILETVVGDAIVVTFAPEDIRRPRLHP